MKINGVSFWTLLRGKIVNSITMSELQRKFKKMLFGKYQNNF